MQRSAGGIGSLHEHALCLLFNSVALRVPRLCKASQKHFDSLCGGFTGFYQWMLKCTLRPPNYS